MRWSIRQLHDAAFSLITLLPNKPCIDIKPGISGFFGKLFATLNGVRFAEMNCLDATVTWGPSSPYYDAEMGMNAWSYYFERARFDFSSPRGRTFRLSYRPGAHDFLAYTGLTVRQSVGMGLRAWCQPRPDILDAVAAFAEAHFKKCMLGVHVRLTDAAAGAEGRQTVPLSAYFSAVDAWMSSNEGHIYLATDDARVVDAFTERYRGQVCFSDCIRSASGDSIHGHYDRGIEGSPYQKGREVLIDALLLARCNQLIRTHSRVTCFSMCWNEDLVCRDLEVELLGVDRTPWLHN
jgi:hypothetical protein